LPICGGIESALASKATIPSRNPNIGKTSPQGGAFNDLRGDEENRMMNKEFFEGKWSLIRGQINARWNQIVEYDLLKVDKAEVKFDKFVSMLQVKYGYTRQGARDEIGKFWAEYESNNRSNT
jgi:hypothetical protein